MTTEAEAISTIRTKIETDFSAAPVYWLNEQEIQLPGRPEPFVFVEISMDKGVPYSYGQGVKYKVNGFIDATVFTPRGTGQKKNAEIAESFTNLFRQFNDGNVVCDGFDRVNRGLLSDDGNYYGVNYIILFYYFQT